MIKHIVLEYHIPFHKTDHSNRLEPQQQCTYRSRLAFRIDRSEENFSPDTGIDNLYRQLTQTKISKRRKIEKSKARNEVAN